MKYRNKICILHGIIWQQVTEWRHRPPSNNSKLQHYATLDIMAPHNDFWMRLDTFNWEKNLINLCCILFMLIYSNSWTTFYTKQWKHFKNDTQRWTMPYRNRWNPWPCSMTTWAMLASGHFKQYQTASDDMKCAGTNSLRDLWNNVVMTPGRVCWLIRTDYIQSDWTRGRMVKGRRGYTTIGLPGRGLAWMSFVKSRIYSDTTKTSILGKQSKAKLIKKNILWFLILEPTKGMCCLRQRQMGCPDTDSSQNLPKTLLAGRVAALVPSSQS